MMFLAALLAAIGTGELVPSEIVLRGPAPACTITIDGRIVTRADLENVVRRTAA